MHGPKLCTSTWTSAPPQGAVSGGRASPAWVWARAKGGEHCPEDHSTARGLISFVATASPMPWRRAGGCPAWWLQPSSPWLWAMEDEEGYTMLKFGAKRSAPRRQQGSGMAGEAIGWRRGCGVGTEQPLVAQDHQNSPPARGWGDVGLARGQEMGLEGGFIGEGPLVQEGRVGWQISGVEEQKAPRSTTFGWVIRASRRMLPPSAGLLTQKLPTLPGLPKPFQVQFWGPQGGQRVR